ncbi:hypothetical protein ACFFMN_23610 [Planobispora siamensis]|uniref:Uncharacterized protein n=1 Tax=Planobispora siamensis TaxID=936338 RepID=A0A8J3SM28_9ACTN|nr:hypothetical protein [Planobispora siamensis]GIH95352.1 hypothetical protein Psi01_59820 [Planobispora siamensis]
MTSNPSGRVVTSQQPTTITDLIEVLKAGDMIVAQLKDDPTDDVVDLALKALRVLNGGKDLPRQARDKIISALADNVRELNLAVIGNAAGLNDAMVSRIATAGGARPRTYRGRKKAVGDTGKASM